jgi:hypothetical protein
MQSVIDLRQFMGLKEGEHYYKGYFIPAMPGWLRVMVSKLRSDGLVEARNFKVFLDNEGNVLWQKPGLSKVQQTGDFERELTEFRQMLEGAGMPIFIEDYRG